MDLDGETQGGAGYGLIDGAAGCGGLVERHGSESYFIVGEGLVGESGQGRAFSSMPTAAGAAAAPPFRFSRMGPKGTAVGEAVRGKVARAMTAGGGGDSTVPAGFTYLGQFVDHDLTFDRTKVMLGENVSPAELLQARSPALDLDSLYGAGPQNAGSAKFYSRRPHLKTGTTDAVGSDGARAGFDLPRAGTGPNRAAKRAALIPDPRNDENLAVAQTHRRSSASTTGSSTALPGRDPAAQRFAAARELVVKHYQWMLRHDYLPRICAPAVVDDVFTHGRKVFEVHRRRRPTCPPCRSSSPSPRSGSATA